MAENDIHFIKQQLEKNISDDDKYNICHTLFNQYRAIGNEETAIYYLVYSAKYNTNSAHYKVKCISELIQYYCCKDMNEIALLYYRLLEDHYNNNTVEDSLDANFIVPYYMAIVCNRLQKDDIGIELYRRAFTKLYSNINRNLIGNFIFNLQFYIHKVDNSDKAFFEAANKYINELEDRGYDIKSYDFIMQYEKYGIKLQNVSYNPNFTDEECKLSKNILIYTGYMTHKWNYTYSLTNALGGSETAAVYLANMLPKDYNIYVAGHVEEESYDNITYIHNDNLKELIEKTPFYAIIVSRYVDFYNKYNTFSAYKTFIWGHDIYLFSTVSSVESILNKWSKKINGCICQTEWHKNQLLSVHPELNRVKLYTINNGIDINKIDKAAGFKLNKKVNNRFIYSSCSERGLERLLELWPQILSELPDAELFIASYNTFPSSLLDHSLKGVIDNYSSSINHVGKLTKDELYALMATSEYWMYPTCFDETSCITSMELLANEVICLYYPRAGLINTVSDYGIQISPGNEIKTLLSLTDAEKDEYKKRGRKYAEEICNWSNRITEWTNIVFENRYINDATYKHFKFLEENNKIPDTHINYLKELSIKFNPEVIYDIGSCVLNWTNEAKHIWDKSEIILFEAMDEAEQLYTDYNYKYNIGVLTDIDNKQIEFYQNNTEPGGNSYYKEIGHSKSHILFNDANKKYKKGMTLESIVKSKCFKLPDLVKIDVQGAELDILRGGMNVINNAKYLIIELQKVKYNDGAPLADITIKYLENNGWELITKDPFCDNGPDGDYCFKNTRDNTDRNILNANTLFILPYWYCPEILDDYLDSIKEKYYTNYIKIYNNNKSSINIIKKYNPTNIIFILGIYNNKDIMEYAISNNISIGILNTEPLTITPRFNEFKNNIIEINKYNHKYIIYDYSKSNIKLLNNNGYLNIEHLPYNVYKNETELLTKLKNTTNNLYDFGIIGVEKGMVDRRRNIIEYIRDNTEYTVKVIEGWKEERDRQIAECRVILNIHGWYNEPTNIFEHIRCDRLLEAGFTILSEESYELDPDFQKKYPNLHIIKYEDFFNNDILHNIKLISNNSNINND